MGFIIEALWAGGSWLFRTQMGRWILGLTAYFGISFATQHFAVQPFIDQLKAQANAAGSAGGSWGAKMAAWLGVMQFDKAITMVCSAVATKFALNATKTFIQKKST